MSWIELIADRKIRDAQEEGAFDNLPGKGKPLQLDTDPRIAPELRAAHRMMKEAQILPDWIQLDKDLRARQAQWETRVEQFDRLRAEGLAEYAGTRRRETESRIDRQRERFLHHAAEELRSQNSMIDRLNLIVPASRQRARLPVRERVAELEHRFPRLAPYPPGEGPSWLGLLEEDRPATRVSNRMPLRRKRGSIG